MHQTGTIPGGADSRHELIASPWHTFSILLIFGYFSFRDARHANTADSVHAVVTHGAILRGYLLSMAYEWGMAYWAWVGVHLKGGRLADLTGGRWTNWRNLALDASIALPFWGVWELTAWLAHLAVGRVHTPTTPYQPPSGFVEVFLWILLSVSAGICEELVFRGYLQQQARSATRSVVAAVVLQGALFGLVHAYQGWKQVIVIVPLGILVRHAGGLAPQSSRQHDRPCLVGHFRGLVAFSINRRRKRCDSPPANGLPEGPV